MLDGCLDPDLLAHVLHYIPLGAAGRIRQWLDAAQAAMVHGPRVRASRYKNWAVAGSDGSRWRRSRGA